MYTFKVTGIEELKTYLSTVRGRYFRMLRTMIDVAEVIHAETNPLVPLDTGRLEESFHWQVVEYNRDLIEVQVVYDAEDPDSHFVYAEYQHDKIETWQHYRKANRRGEMRGIQYYLTEGVRKSEDMAYEIIESDYLSLFGGIVLND